MADESNNAASPQQTGRNRRSSFAGETFANLFGGGRSNSITRGNNSSDNSNSSPTQQYPGPITTAAAQAQRRRMSLTTLGLSGSPGHSSYRRESNGSAQSGSIDESAIEDDSATGSTPQTPFARRMSFGAKALRDVRSSSSGSSSAEQNGKATSASSNHPAIATGQISSRAEAKGREGFNWSDNFRTRAERTSMAAQNPSPPSASAAAVHERAKSVATTEAPVKQMPQPKEQKRPDPFQERILKGDFYMD